MVAGRGGRPASFLRSSSDILKFKKTLSFTLYCWISWNYSFRGIVIFGKLSTFGKSTNSENYQSSKCYSFPEKLHEIHWKILQFFKTQLIHNNSSVKVRRRFKRYLNVVNFNFPTLKLKLLIIIRIAGKKVTRIFHFISQFERQRALLSTETTLELDFESKFRSGDRGLELSFDPLW